MQLRMSWSSGVPLRSIGVECFFPAPLYEQRRGWPPRDLVTSEGLVVALRNGGRLSLRDTARVKAGLDKPERAVVGWVLCISRAGGCRMHTYLSGPEVDPGSQLFARREASWQQQQQLAAKAAGPENFLEG